MSHRRRHKSYGALPPGVKSALSKTWAVSKRAGQAVGRGAKKAATAAHKAACRKMASEMDAPSVKLVLESGNRDKLAKSLRAAQWSYKKACKLSLVLVLATLFSWGASAIANTVSDQGMPGKQGPWPVKCVAGDGGTPTTNCIQAPATEANSGATAISIGLIPTDAGYLPATQVPPGDAGMPNRTGLTLQNLDTSPIWCGFTSSVNDLTGTQVDGAADSTHSGGTFVVPAGSNLPVYCWSRAGQVSPTNVRWIEMR